VGGYRQPVSAVNQFIFAADGRNGQFNSYQAPGTNHKEKTRAARHRACLPVAAEPASTEVAAGILDVGEIIVLRAPPDHEWGRLADHYSVLKEIRS
jgi:hypothetical protein